MDDVIFKGPLTFITLSNTNLYFLVNVEMTVDNHPHRCQAEEH